ncbi:MULTISPECIES: hypothetical protein [Nocardia]|uniref:hypothetical protein n=1 Tax=Nocardia TaxID=1817 RepID=UPI00135823C5|nr:MULTISPECIES: hypothetical protein [Nocardia]
MSESRQQRRARERAEQKAATRPGPNLRAVPDPPTSDEVGSVRVAVELRWLEDFWNATWGEAESDEAIVEGRDDLEELIDVVVGHIGEEWGTSADVLIDWDLDSDAEAEVVELGIMLLPGRGSEIALMEAARLRRTKDDGRDG